MPLLRRVLHRRRAHGARPAPAREGTPAWRETVTARVATLALAFAVWGGAILARLVYLQVFDHAEMVARAERQHWRTVEAPAKRGDILDRKGRVLATSVDADTIYAVPSEIRDRAAVVAKKLCAALGDCTADERAGLTERLGRPRDHFEYIRRQVDAEVADRLRALDLDGVGFMKESRRHYPKNELAAHVLGFVGTDNRGLAGLEHSYNSLIRGEDGKILIQNDARGRVFGRVERPPTTGSTIELTIDENIQHITERELMTGIAESRAVGGSAIVMNPHTGEILAMANGPTFNPNVYAKSSETARRNRATQDLYEPGSTFKSVTASAAIEERVMPVDALIDTNPGLIRIGNRVIDEYRGHNYHTLSFTDVIVKSSNVGAVKIGFRLGASRLSRYVELFGFGSRVSPDFPGENPGIVWRLDQWTESALASVSMGYQVGVTPLQMVTAVSSIANGGEYVEPRVVRAAYRHNRRQTVKRKTLRRTISADTAAAMTTIMEKVVDAGTAKAAQIPGHTVAGKTGTAEKLINGRYSFTDNYASFVGFVPSRDPVVAIIVVIDSPRGNGTSGGVVAAPIFRRIAELTLRQLGVAPTINPAPPVIVPSPGEPVLVKAPVDETGPIVPIVADGPVVPDLRGASARDALRQLAKLGMTARIVGDGFVVSQQPEPGAPAEDGMVCRLVLGRAPVATPIAEIAGQP
jgi:cell division protein FtsI (penicillin-binding protein 3)